MLELKNNKHNTCYHCAYLYLFNAIIFKLLLTSYLKRDLAKWCFINKVREEHDQIINRFGTGATRLANHPNEHNAYMYK